jgi:general transcription factor 3C polypeptide 3 (transcription factor C subunit 4)
MTRLMTMEQTDDGPDDISPRDRDIVYPEIDETVQYPWQWNSSTRTSVLDPRLHRGAFAADGGPISDRQPGSDDTEEDFSVDEGERSDEDLSHSSGDPSFIMSGEESLR